jgi:maltooligosyltrehalose trehalohydrolase
MVNHAMFEWNDASWQGMNLQDMIMYELHVGTFTPEGTFESIIPRLGDLKELGINTIEIMPVAQFPGERNWGYDGVLPFAVQNSYGGPHGLKTLIDYCHKMGIAVILDVVYNHFGPEGNYLRDFGPYFTQKYKTPWGEAINFDGAYSDAVRNYFIQNALYWFEYYHIDALRLDAIHAIFDKSAKPFLKELYEKTTDYAQTHNKRCYLIAESDLNDSRIIRPEDQGGYGLHAQWSDDFHHSVHTLLTGESTGYYADFGKVSHLEKVLTGNYAYSWDFSQHRKRHHGNSAADLEKSKFVVCVQNHDQVGNRMLGERLASLVSFEALKCAAGVLLLSPFIPLLFMGEEYGEQAPFLYFVNHGDPDLLKAVREGRKAEFKSFNWDQEPPIPDDPETFSKSKLNWNVRTQAEHSILLQFFSNLCALRKTIPALKNVDIESLDVETNDQKRTLLVKRWKESSQIFYICNFNTKDVQMTIQLPAGHWKKVLDSAENKWNGPGSDLPLQLDKNTNVIMKSSSFVLYKIQGDRL